MKIMQLQFMSAALIMLAIGVGIPKALADESILGKPTACGRCGDGYCATQCGETARNCSKDCGVVESTQLACGKCGDGRCTPQCGETARSCPKDCGVESRSIIDETRL